MIILSLKFAFFVQKIDFSSENPENLTFSTESFWNLNFRCQICGICIFKQISKLGKATMNLVKQNLMRIFFFNIKNI